MAKKTREEQNAYMREYMLKRYHARRNEAIQQLGGKCAHCGSTERLEIDHEDYTEKSFNLAKRVSGAPPDVLAKELAKCQLLCRGCHGAKTTLERGWQVSKLPTGEVVHGTKNSYRYCKCETCKVAYKAYKKELLEAGNFKHGQGGYTLGCRCELCSEAKRLARKPKSFMGS